MAFISRHDISIEEIFDVRGLPGSRWKQDSKEREIPFVYGNACYNGGHRLKNRSGHCIQCDTARIRFIRRETETADLYIAVASNGALFKVGVARDLFHIDLMIIRLNSGIDERLSAICLIQL